MGKPQQTRKSKQGKGKKQASKHSKHYGVVINDRLFAPRMSGRMAYTTNVLISPAAGAASANVFRLNSIFDPDLTGTGTTVADYTVISGIYGLYRVQSFRVSLEFVGQSLAVALQPGFVFAAITPANTIGVSPTTISTQDNTWLSYFAGGVTNPLRHRLGGTVAYYYGATPQQVATEDSFSSVMGANPGNSLYLHVGGYGVPGSGQTIATSVLVKIEYDVVFSLPKQASF